VPPARPASGSGSSTVPAPLETLVPLETFFRRLNDKLGLGFVRRLPRELRAIRRIYHPAGGVLSPLGYRVTETRTMPAAVAMRDLAQSIEDAVRNDRTAPSSSLVSASKRLFFSGRCDGSGRFG
jgi:hypothetical protein